MPQLLPRMLLIEVPTQNVFGNAINEEIHPNIGMGKVI